MTLSYEAKIVADLILDHLRTMYPAALQAVPQNAALSLRNFSAATVERAIQTAKAEAYEEAAQLCAGHIELVGSKGRWLEPHEPINEEMYSGLTYAAAIRKLGSE